VGKVLVVRVGNGENGGNGESAEEDR
jgi:hypothetical protein